MERNDSLRLKPVVPPPHFPILPRITPTMRPMPPVTLPPAGHTPLLRVTAYSEILADQLVPGYGRHN